MIKFDPDKFIDRDVERELFSHMLKFEDDARLLTIRDAGGRGKSSLLKRLRYECGRFHDPSELAGLVPLDELNDHSAFTLVTEIKEQLTNFAETYHLEVAFPMFDQLSQAYHLQDYEPFLDLEELRLGARPRGTGADPGDWTPQKDAKARKACINAFFENLREISDAQPVIVLLDSWEHAEFELKQWIVSTIVRPLCFGVETRPDKFGLVLAGRELPDFKPELKSEAEHDRLVRSTESLGLWDEDHVRDFLRTYGYESLSEEAFSVQLIHTRLKDGWPVSQVFQLVEAMTAVRES